MHLAHCSQHRWGDIGGVVRAGPVGVKDFAVGGVECHPDCLGVRVDDYEGAFAAAVMGEAELGDEVFADCGYGWRDGVGVQFGALPLG